MIYIREYPSPREEEKKSYCKLFVKTFLITFGVLLAGAIIYIIIAKLIEEDKEKEGVNVGEGDLISIKLDFHVCSIKYKYNKVLLKGDEILLNGVREEPTWVLWPSCLSGHDITKGGGGFQKET